MAQTLDRQVLISENDLGTVYFEDLWYVLNDLTSFETILQRDIPIFDNGKATKYFEDIWNEVAEDLGKDMLDINVILMINGFATRELEVYWEDLIT